MAQIKENIKAPPYWPLWGNSLVAGEFPSQRASNAENDSIWWRHYGETGSPLGMDNLWNMLVCKGLTIFNLNIKAIRGNENIDKTIYSPRPSDAYMRN